MNLLLIKMLLFFIGGAILNESSEAVTSSFFSSFSCLNEVSELTKESNSSSELAEKQPELINHNWFDSRYYYI